MREQRPDDVPEVLPADAPPRRLACPHCGGTDRTPGVSVGAEGRIVGLRYRRSGGLGLPSLLTEPLHATLCNRCSTVVRLSVSSMERHWLFIADG